MRTTKIAMPILIAGLAMVLGCAKPPQAEIDAARAAIQQAEAAGAGEYAAGSLREAQNAVEALNAEVEVQAKKFALMRSYKQSSALAATAKAAGEKAAADAETAKEAARTEAEQKLGEATAAMEAANAALANAPRGKGSAQEIEAMKADMEAVAQWIQEGTEAHTNGHFLQSKSKFEQALNKSNEVTSAVEAARAMKAGRR